MAGLAERAGAWLERVKGDVLGDPLNANLVPEPVSYEEVHNEVQSILLPPTYPKGLTVHVNQSLNSHFALTHKVALAPGEMQRTMFGPMPGPGSRFYALGGVVSHKAPAGGAWRVAAQYDPENGNGKGTVVGDVWGDKRLRLQGQLVDSRKDARTEWGATARYAGEDFVAVARLKHGPEAYVSYNQRLAPRSLVTVGGELCLSVPELLKLRGSGGKPAGGAGAPKPLDLAFGLAYDAGLSKTALHYAATKTFAAGIFSLHRLERVTPRSTLAAKLMVNAGTRTSMAAVGYKLHFRNTLTTLYGMVDTYGTLRQVVEREPLKGLKVGLSMEARLAPGAAAPGEAATFGFKVTMGSVAPFQPPLSPVTMTRDIFGAA